MTIIVTTEIACEHEHCKAVFHGVKLHSDKAKAAPRFSRAKAKEQGWTRADGKDFCPQHKPVWKKVLVPAE